MAVSSKPNPLRVSSTTELRDRLKRRNRDTAWWDGVETWLSDHELNLHNREVSPSIVRKIAGQVTQAVVEVEGAETFSPIVNNLGKGWRAALLIRRKGGNRKFSANTSGQDADNKAADKANHHIAIKASETKSKKLNKNLSLAQKDSNWIKLRNTKIEMGDNGIDIPPREVPPLLSSKTINNRVHIVNLVTGEYLELQQRPSELEVRPTSNWVSVKSMGRNNPFYMFTSGDDSISFEVTWYMDSGENRQDVLTKCRLLERWSKADGYKLSPPVLGIVWGTSEIFRDDTFILESAPYTLKNFQNGRRPTPSFKSGRDVINAEESPKSSDPTNRGLTNIYRTQHFNDSFYDLSAYKNYGLLPGYAVQQLTFKRVTPHNRTYQEIVSDELVTKVLHKVTQSDESQVFLDSQIPGLSSSDVFLA